MADPNRLYHSDSVGGGFAYQKSCVKRAVQRVHNPLMLMYSNKNVVK